MTTHPQAAGKNSHADRSQTQKRRPAFPHVLAEQSHPAIVGVVFVVALAGLLMARSSVRTLASSVDLTVSAAISLQNTLQEIARSYHGENPGVTIHLNLGASGTLQRQIEQGAPVDLFLSAAPAEMNSLESKNLIILDTRKNLVANSVVLVTPKGRGEIRHFQDLTRPDIRVIAIGNPLSVPAGKYAEEVLTHLGLYDRLKPKFVLAKDVRAVLTYVETANVDAGIVYETDALTSNAVTVVATAPPGSHSPVIYPVAVIAGSHNVAAAKAFEAFLFGPKAAAVFGKDGFNPLPQSGR
jgi:molybdate transport system substrate-binding protein